LQTAENASSLYRPIRVLSTQAGARRFEDAPSRMMASRLA
jgi:hypothetical protein